LTYVVHSLVLAVNLAAFTDRATISTSIVSILLNNARTTMLLLHSPSDGAICILLLLAASANRQSTLHPLVGECYNILRRHQRIYA